jgi:ATP-dependent protease ClpP protease subunit
VSRRYGQARCHASFSDHYVSLINDICHEHVIAVMEWTKTPTLPLVICSNGGCTAAARAIIDILRAFPNSTVIGSGVVASSAAGIFLAGGRRLCTRSALFLFHEPYAVYSRDASEYQDGMAVGAKSLGMDRELFRDLLTEHNTIIPDSDVDRLVNGAGDILTAAHMYDIGLVDEVVTDEKYAKLLVPPKTKKKKPTSRRPK